MDFSLTQEQQDIKALAAKILADLAPPESLPDFEQPRDWFDERLWRELAGAQLLGIGLAEDVGGGGMGIFEVCVLLEEAGRACAPVPLWPTLLLGAAPIDAFGSPALRSALLPGVIAGNVVLTAALAEESSRDVLRPACTAERDGNGWVLDGVKSFVPAAASAARILVTARTGPSSVGVFAVEPGAPGVTLEPQATTTGENEYRVTLKAVRVDADSVIGDAADGTRVVEWIVERAIAGLCAMEVGVADRALRMAAEYTGNRRQFGKPIATFQAVAQRAADAYIDLEAVRLATWQAVWRLAQGLPAKRELSIAKFWAAEGGHRACYAAQHLHGGIGVDKDYPLHHFYLQSRRIELTLGGAHTHLAELGKRLARGDTGRP
jgi:alkylation response protein AidB-like acyl-CoA dehydrogenase